MTTPGVPSGRVPIVSRPTCVEPQALNRGRSGGSPGPATRCARPGVRPALAESREPVEPRSPGKPAGQDDPCHPRLLLGRRRPGCGARRRSAIDGAGCRVRSPDGALGAARRPQSCRRADRPAPRARSDAGDVRRRRTRHRDEPGVPRRKHGAPRGPARRNRIAGTRERAGPARREPVGGEGAAAEASGGRGHGGRRHGPQVRFAAARRTRRLDRGRGARTRARPGRRGVQDPGRTSRRVRRSQ